MNSMNKLLTILTEGGMVSGFGHVTRCIAIADGFKKHGFIIKFLINGDSSVYSVIERRQVNLCDWTKLDDKLLETLNNSSIILIDSIEVKINN